MTTMIVDKVVLLAQQMLKDRLSLAQCVVDATAGNGRDTLFLAQSTPYDAVIWAFDIQASALANTNKLLHNHGLGSKVRLINKCHSRIDDYLRQPIDVAMFNLGYLPGGEHSLVTKPATTIAALQKVLALLAVDGIISIVAYPGHPDGRLENETVHNYVGELPSNEFRVGCWSMVNQQNAPPLLYLIENTGGGKREIYPTGENQRNH